ncbi:TPA: hypothetical protein ACH3X1_013877 [Trebouxia sp. C0004]
MSKKTDREVIGLHIVDLKIILRHDTVRARKPWEALTGLANVSENQRPMAFHSCKPSGAERRYSAGLEQELLAVNTALRQWRC